MAEAGSARYGATRSQATAPGGIVMSDQNYNEIAPNQVLSAAEGIETQKRFAEGSSAKQWHWMGNYGSVYDPASVANGAGISAGEMILNINFNNGLIAAWMFY
jgi:hypothetical protein